MGLGWGGGGTRQEMFYKDWTLLNGNIGHPWNGGGRPSVQAQTGHSQSS